MENDPKVIAAGLTTAQRRFLTERPYNYRFADGYKPGERLVELGLLDRQQIGLEPRTVITTLGLAVRRELERNDK